MKDYKKMWEKLGKHVEKQRKGFVKRVTQDSQDENAVDNLVIYQNIAYMMWKIEEQEAE